MTKFKEIVSALFVIKVPALILLLVVPTSARRQPYERVDAQDYQNSMNTRYQHSQSSRSASPSWPVFPALPPVQCYSCMSETYDPYMSDMLRQGYRRQDVVTNRCNEPFFSRGIPYINCSNICVTMKETIQVGGLRVMTAYIRGCLDKILTDRHRFNETALLMHNFYRKDHCRELPRSLLIGPTFGGNVWFCACYGNRCNKASTSQHFFQHIGHFLLNYLYDFIRQLHWLDLRTSSPIPNFVISWLVFVASALFHFGTITLTRRILT